MGGDVANVKLMLFARDELERQATLERFTDFDVRSAHCFHEADTARLHGIIEEGFGGLRRFNDTVSEMFTEIARREPPSEAAASATAVRSGRRSAAATAAGTP